MPDQGPTLCCDSVQGMDKPVERPPVEQAVNPVEVEHAVDRQEYEPQNGEDYRVLAEGERRHIAVRIGPQSHHFIRGPSIVTPLASVQKTLSQNWLLKVKRAFCWKGRAS